MSDRHDKSDQSQRAFFGRRKGHPLRPRQTALFETLLPKIALDLTKPAPADLRSLFDNADDVRLEIGFGGAEHLIAQAKRYPRTGFIGRTAISTPSPKRSDPSMPTSSPTSVFISAMPAR